MRDKSIITLLAVVIITALIVIIGEGLSQPQEEFNKSVMIRYYGQTGCCQISAGSCASGNPVTEEVCAKELLGTFSEDKICNMQNGMCE